MYRCRWFVLCENVIHDGRSNNLSMINALSVVRAPIFPAFHVRFSFAAMLDREGESEGPLSLRFVRENDDGDEILFNAKGTNDSPSVVQFFLNFPMGIRLFKEGKVTFRIEALEGDSSWYAVGSQSLQVEVLKQAPELPSHDAEEPTEKETS